MSEGVTVAGVGMTRFRKPSEGARYEQLGEEAARLALADAGLDYPDLQQAYVGYCYGDSTSGQRALYPLGLTGIPIHNVNNNCATGSSALHLARQAIESGAADCVLALGFEQMGAGALKAAWQDRQQPLQFHAETMLRIFGEEEGPFSARLFGGAAIEYADRHGTRPETFAAISVKARRHAAKNPFAVFRDPLTVDEVLASARVYGPLTRYQCCAPTSGGAAAVLCSPRFARSRGLSREVSIVGQAMVTDLEGAFSDSMIRAVGFGMTQAAARQVYQRSGVDPMDVDVVELHDCFAPNELISYEALDLAASGSAERLVCDGDNTYGGRVVINPSGGLLAKGHPLGATGLAQCAELVWQLRGAAGARQVEAARLALQHNLGLGGACVVTLYARNRSARDQV